VVFVERAGLFIVFADVDCHTKQGDWAGGWEVCAEACRKFPGSEEK
jgi:hypothetical protein